MNLVNFVRVNSINADFLVALFLKETGRNLREHSICENILNRGIVNILLCLFLHLLELRFEQIRGTASDRLFRTDYLLAEYGVNLNGSLSVFALYKSLEFLGNRLVAFAENYVEYSLCTYNL